MVEDVESSKDVVVSDGWEAMINKAQKTAPHGPWHWLYSISAGYLAIVV